MRLVGLHHRRHAVHKVSVQRIAVIARDMRVVGARKGRSEQTAIRFDTLVYGTVKSVGCPVANARRSIGRNVADKHLAKERVDSFAVCKRCAAACRVADCALASVEYARAAPNSIASLTAAAKIRKRNTSSVMPVSFAVNPA